jgi:hypothetical protein
MSTFIKMIKLAGTEALIMNAKVALIPIAIAALVALLVLLGEDLYHFFTGGESALGKIGAYIAEFVHSNIRPTIANFLGMTPEELDALFLQALDAIASFYNGLVDWTSFGIEAIIWFGGQIGDTLAKAVIQINLFLMDLKAMGSDVVAFFSSLVSSFVAFVSSIPSKVMAMFHRTVSSIRGILSGLPLVGDLVGGETPVAAPTASLGGLGGLASSPNIKASTGARAAVTNAKNLSTSNQSTQMTNQFNITQRPGESGEDLAFRVSEEIQRASARAVSANDSGIEV